MGPGIPFLRQVAQQYKHPILYFVFLKILETNHLAVFDKNHKYKILVEMFLGHVQMSPNVQNL